MPILLQCGQPEPVLQSVVYALPANRVLMFTATTTASIVQSDLVAMTTTVPVIITTGQAELAGGFIKCTSGNITVFLKRF